MKNDTRIKKECNTAFSKREFTLIPNYGWKKNILMILISIVLCYLLSTVSQFTSSVRGISEFDLVSAVIPFFSFSMGIWWVIGYLIYSVASVAFTLMAEGDGSQFLELATYMMVILATVIYSVLPAILWYAIRLKGEGKPDYPRLDTCAHVIKFYLIMVFSIAVYVPIMLTPWEGTFTREELLSLVYWYMQYLDVVLLVGIPLLIIVSLVRTRTLTINERMVLAFLVIGVIASSMGAYFVYRNTLSLNPSLFEEYESLMQGGAIGMTEASLAAFERYNSYWNRFYVMTAIMLNVLLIIEMTLMYSIEKKVTKPVVRLAEVLEQYAVPESRPEGEEDETAPANNRTAEQNDAGQGPDAVSGRLNPEAVRESCRPYRYGYGEISSLVRTCVDMVGRIDTYTTNLRQITAEKERIGAELDVASKIQKDMLPGVFPPFPDRCEFELYASMTPAKEVGGDFYDFYFVDQDHLALTIADVSGKGIPASLFMVISKTLLKNQAQTGSSPRETLTFVNHQLCQNNEMMMFCTVWLGILDLKTGKLVASNGGHEYPAVKKKDGGYTLMKQIHDPALGIIDGIRYREYEIQLEPEDSLYVYTDGVPEATDASEEQLGEDRMIEALNMDPDVTPERVIARVHEAIHTFVKEEPQFDDITMLCLKYLGPAAGNASKELTVPAREENVEEITRFIAEQLENISCPEDDQFAITLAVEEIFANIASYAYEDGEGDVQVSFSFDENSRMVKIDFSDSGLPFDPTARPAPDITLRPEDRQIGGLGIYIVKQTMDEVKYQYTGGKNQLMIRKRV